MAFTNFGELKTSIANWLHRTDMSTMIPDFVTLCEAEMQRLLTVAEQEQTNTVTLAQNATTITLPTGFQKIRRIRFLWNGVYTDLFPFALSPTYGDGVTPSPPRAISFQGSTLVFANPADQAYPIVLDSYCKFTPLSTDVSTNWILTDHPDAYLYGALMQSAPFLGTDDRLGIWADGFTSTIDEINQLDYQRRMSQVQRVSDVPWVGRPYGDQRYWQ